MRNDHTLSFTGALVMKMTTTLPRSTILRSTILQPRPARTELIRTPIASSSTTTNTSQADKPLLLKEVYSYPGESTPNFVIPGFRGFSYSAASVSHTRSLTFIKKHLGGPMFGLGENLGRAHAL